MSRGPPPPSASYGLNVDDLLIDDGGWAPVAVAEPLPGGAARHDGDGGIPAATAEAVETAEPAGGGSPSGEGDEDGDGSGADGAVAPAVVRATAYAPGDSARPAAAATVQAALAAELPPEVGQLVVLTGLARGVMNGTVGEVLAALGGDRWEVRVAAAGPDGGGPRRSVSVRSRNLAPKPIEAGERVRLHSIIRSDELNGMTGRVLSTGAGTGRLTVRLPGVRGRLVAVLPGNARAVSGDCRGEHAVPPGGAAGGGSVPLLAETPSDPDRADAQPAGGTDSALGDAFSTGGASNAGGDVPAATAIAG